MSTFVKGKLKAARDALGKRDYEKAKDASLEVLEYETENYNANVFLGLALLNLKQSDESEQAYRKAIKISPDQPLAWQGLTKLYEEAQKWNEYVDALERLAQAFAKADDATKCAETIQKLIEFRRKPDHYTRVHLAQTLSLLLPDSPFYSVLSALPPPDPTNPTASAIHFTQEAMQNSLPVLEEIVSLYEQEEEESVEKEVSKRRTRLGAGSPEQIRKEVTLEVLGSSQLPRLYNDILNHPNTSDELRRATESKLLRHKQRYLYGLPATGKLAAQKASVAAEVEELVNGMVLLEVRDELAWTLFIEGKDAETTEQYDFDTLCRYIRLFPDAALAKLVAAYFKYMNISLSEAEDEEMPHDRPVNEDEDYVNNIIDAFNALPDSLLAHRIMVEVYQIEDDLEDAIKVASKGLELVKTAEENTGRPLTLVRKAFNVALATSLVHYFPPKHHSRALGIIIDILGQDPDNVPCLLGRGYILQYSGKWSEAGELFAKVAQLLPDDLDQGIRAREEHAWCQVHCRHDEDAAAELRDIIATVDTLDGRDTDKARCWWRLGKCYWQMGNDHREEAYRCFITSLKRSPTFAPAFTSLGIYYSDFLSPPDPNRASKCFQKAFELDPREAKAARRLAEGFAEEQEWDLVEIVARRTIDGEGGWEGGTAMARYLPVNAWAWKAVGVVELNRHNYPPAIQAFQIALRTDSDDQLLWLRLGEAYSKAGRFAAALKALERARELDPDDWICSYFIGDVQRQTGEYAEAIKAFKLILTNHPSEIGVLLSLGQTYLDLGRAEVATAYLARAESSFVSAIRVMLQFVEISSGFRRVAWKTAADAVRSLSQLRSFSDEDNVRSVLANMAPLLSGHPGTSISDIIPSTFSLDSSSDLSLAALELAVAAYDYRITLDSLDDRASGNAHYDLGASLFSYSRRTTDGSRRERILQESIRHIKEALRTEPGNDDYWNALANATFESQPKIAQHAFIRALEIDSKNTATWANLGLFYLHHGDTELANESFFKAQTLDPDYALAWVGQGLVATVNGHTPEARALFEHAVGLTAPVPDADVEFSKRLFDRVNSSSESRLPATDALFPAFFVLDRFCRERPQDASALHLFGLICERVGHLQLGEEMLAHAISLLEAAYEESEDPVIERRFTIAHTNLARLRLSLRDYEGALESLQIVMGLLPEEPEDHTSRILLTHAQCVSGLAQLKLGQLAEAVGLFQAALNAAIEDFTLRGHVIILLAQTLWAVGSYDGRESAKTQLLQSIESDPENLMAINILAGMGILTDDDSLVDAALSEILGLPLDERLSRDPGRDVTYLLIQHHLAQGDITQALSVAQRAVMAEPSQPEIRQNLASLDLRQGRSDSALAMIVGSSSTREDNLARLREFLHLEAIARSLAKSDRETKTEAQKIAQRAVMLTPWEQRNWQALAFVRTQCE